MIVWKHNRENIVFSIFTSANDKITLFAKKVCMNLTHSMYACFIFLPLFFINRLQARIQDILPEGFRPDCQKTALTKFVSFFLVLSLFYSFTGVIYFPQYSDRKG